MKNLLLLALATLALSACGSKMYKAQIDYVSEEAKARRDQFEARTRAADALATAAVSKCAPNDSACVATVMMGRALQEHAISGSSGNAPLQLPQRPPSGGELVAGILRGAIPAALQAGAQWHATDANVDIARSNNDTQRALYEGVFGALDSALTNSGTHIDVGGNFGDTYGNDFTGGDRTTTIAGRDQNGRDSITNDGIINDGDGNRFDSDGPFEDVGNGGDGGDGGDCPGGEGAGGDCSGGDGG